MYNKPKFKSIYTVEVIKSVGVFLLSEADYFVLTGELYEAIAPLVDGCHTVDDIVDRLQGQASPAEIYYLLMVMEQKGYIVENDPAIPLDLGAFWDMLEIDRTEAMNKLRSTQVAVKAFGNVSTQEFTEILRSIQVQVSEHGEIAIVLTDDYLQPGLAEFNRQALQSKQPWMLVKPVGKTIWIGPIFYPEKTGCWECLAQRLRGNRLVENFIEKHQKKAPVLPTSITNLSSNWHIGLNLAATETAKWIAKQKPPSSEPILVTFNTLTLQTQNHVLTKRPQCPVCGEAKYLTERKFTPIILQNCHKNFTSDGGHRHNTPAETIKKYEKHISPITGAIAELRQVTVSETDLTNVYVAGHNFATMFDDLYFLRQNLRGKSAGKGKTDIQAKASALGEAIERYSGVFQGDEIRQKSTYQKLADAAIHPNRCMNFSLTQYETRAEWNAECPNIFQKVAEPFDEKIEIEWTPVWSLTHQKIKYLPTAYCYYGYLDLPKPYCWADSNGTAAGNTLEEAILQGFMEIVERDSVALWWYNQITRPEVDLESFDEPYFLDLQSYYEKCDRQLWVLDITSDFNIPTFAAISQRTDKEIEDITLGFGTHFDPKIAISRALTEANQMLPAVSQFDEKGNTKYNYSDPLGIQWWKTATLANKPYLIPDQTTQPKIYADYPQQSSEDLLEDVLNCIKITEKHGMEMLVLDQTRPDIGLNVAKVIVPGMRHFWKRLAPGRLYDIPVKLGWLSQPKSESELNLFPIFF